MPLSERMRNLLEVGLEARLREIGHEEAGLKVQREQIAQALAEIRNGHMSKGKQAEAALRRAWTAREKKAGRSARKARRGRRDAALGSRIVKLLQAGPARTQELKRLAAPKSEFAWRHAIKTLATDGVIALKGTTSGRTVTLAKGGE